jgi:DNA gyrase subunit B
LNILEQLLLLPAVSEDKFEDKAWLTGWTEQLSAALQKTLNGDGGNWEIALEEGDAGISGIGVDHLKHGVDNKSLIPMSFFASSEYAHIAELGTELDGFIEPGAYIERGEQKVAVSSFREAMDWLLAQARKGQHISRYKGLGEMNPEQLWETTINPESRRLLQVRIEDAVGSDEIFTTLMGDQVEPRREFIERNALTVANLDV